MLPPKAFPGTKSPGEIEIFRRLKDDPLTKDWIVLHSLDIANHEKQVEGEIDFLIIVPAKGVLCLEVKAIRSLLREDGLWYLGSSAKPDSRGPFRQASSAMHSMRRQLLKQNPRFSKVVFWSAVIFPYLEFKIASNEWHPWQAIDIRQFNRKSMGEIVIAILDQAREHIRKKPSTRWFNPSSVEPTESQTDQIANLLRPNFEFYESPESRLNRRKEELKKYTQEQFDALDSMEHNPRVIYSGPAGTGKTVLAIEMARRKSIDNRKVLFLCFNRLLGNSLIEETKTLKPNVKTSTIHSHMLSIAGIVPEDNAESYFWETALTQSAIENLLENDTGAHVYDAVIVDEAQDILLDDYLDFLDLSLKGGLSSGNWAFFGDFEKQAIYTNHNVIELLQERFPNVPRYSLRVNCRNTPRIAELVHILAGLTPKYTRIRRPDNFIEPDIKVYQDKAQQQKLLSRALDQIFKDKYLGKDVTILSPYSETRCVASEINDKWKPHLKPFFSISSPKQIGFGSIHSFKGLEAPVIIITDIDDIGSELANSLFYVAMTRALERLIILVNENVRTKLLDMILSKTS